ncbi:YgaP-like transmembrane domain [Sorangium sp. So ce1182]|uniref:YgaP-like transmembrane domain n=1 Tax=Sorangium sp. So ce1182 TaxID=3133334 RepID=UPI003F5DE67C
MKRNLGKMDRLFRGLGALALLACAWAAPLPLAARLAALGAAGVYLLFTALSGTCLGYALMGRSTCPLPRG